MSFVRAIAGVRTTTRSVVLRRPALQIATTSRTIHRASTLQKAKGAKNDDSDDAFAIEADDELFATPSQTSSQQKADTSAAQAARLSEKRAKEFQQNKEKLLANPAYAAYHRWLEQNSGKSTDSPVASEAVKVRHAKATHAPRRAILALLSASASTREELFEIVNIFSIYRAKGWHVDELNRIDFIGRCINLKSPDIALAVLYHRPRFGIDIPSISTARTLLHSLLINSTPPPTPLPSEMALPTSTPFAHALLLANLFDVYALPPVEQDEVARALLLGACTKEAEGEESEDTSVVMQKVREWAENPQLPKPEGAVVDQKGPGIKDGKIIKTSQALKMAGKPHMRKRPAQTPPTIVLPEDVPLYSIELTTPEKAWIKMGLDRFVQWAQAKGEDVAWVEKLKVETA